MPEKDAFERIRPKTRKQQKELLAIVGFIALGILFAVGLLIVKYKVHAYREENWNSAVATVIDFRTKIVGKHDGGFGGAMLYQVEVLADFKSNGVEQQRWIAVTESPRSYDYAMFQGRFWKGKQCFVHWKPSNPNEIIVEIN